MSAGRSGSCGATVAAPTLVLDRDVLIVPASALGVAVPTRTIASGKTAAQSAPRLSAFAAQPEAGALRLCSADDCAVVVVDRGSALSCVYGRAN